MNAKVMYADKTGDYRCLSMIELGAYKRPVAVIDDVPGLVGLLEAMRSMAQRQACQEPVREVRIGMWNDIEAADDLLAQLRGNT